MPWIQSQIKQKDGLLTQPPLSPLLSSSLSSSSSSSSSSPSSSSGSKISPAVLFIIIILAVIFFICGLVHMLVRFVIKQRSSSSSISQSNRHLEMSGSDAFERQLQQLFHLHDSGLDQAYIDALPVFLYKEVIGLKEPFDCAVCLCEFSEQDKLRLLPLCSHAFHIDCIDTWLLSNSTCPLCRGTLFTPGFSIENPVFAFDDSRVEDGVLGNGVVGVPCGQKPAEIEIVGERRVFPVSLGKFRTTNDGGGGGGGGVGGGGGEERGGGETSSSSLDARRCFSMGSYQYVVDSNLQVALCPNRGNGNGGAGGANVRVVKGRGGHNGNSSIDGDVEGKKINIRSKGESFSVSKVWLWPKKGKFPSSSDTHMVSLPWTERTQAT
ncbi:RING-H2 finger protein ATL46-like [Cornus florida]|uniref:RING-H2 finger protein ATL46-like n=1 Tax=Cornus florida TaxID=4283 RepID=UPI002899A1FF|nr:RING-H2 finger protein ATL46-like [Cornus florida]XP_059656028.1 RING-H2 finger protein ATL46-like [Cornus florida]